MKKIKALFASLTVTRRELLLLLSGSAILAFGLEWVLYDALVEKINTVDALRLFSFVPFTGDMMIPMLATFGAAGLFVGIVGSWTSIRKFMDV